MTLRTKRNFNLENHRLYLIQIGTKQEIARYYESCILLSGQAGFEYDPGQNLVIPIDKVSKITEIPDNRQGFYEWYITVVNYA